jgi:carbonic anhydrase
MHKLLEGVVQFKKEDYESHKSLFKDLGRIQKPHTLFIGCSDSRIVPNLITKTMPGELFMVRNIANLVPKYRESAEYFATTSAIEYAVIILNVETILICGHSNCGGCAALYAPDELLKKIPHTRKWLELASPVKYQVLSQVDENDHEAREWLTEQTNIVEQMKHLLTYPFIREKYEKGELKILGWYYIIETGEIYNYNKDQGCFELINA